MFDITSSKLLILGIVALLVIGPKDLPALLRTIGKYLGIIKRQAAEFRAQFEEAMRDSELQQLKKDVETVGQETEATMRAAGESVEKELAEARTSVDASMEADAKPAPVPEIEAAGGEPAASPASPESPLGAPSAPAETAVSSPLNGASHPEASAAATSSETAAEPGRLPEKSGA